MSRWKWYLQFAVGSIAGSFFLVYLLGYFGFKIGLSALLYPALAFSLLFVVSGPLIYWGRSYAARDLRPLLLSIGITFTALFAFATLWAVRLNIISRDVAEESLVVGIVVLVPSMFGAYYVVKYLLAKVAR